MKKAFYAVAFLAGAVVGAVSGAFAMNKYIHKHYDISEKTDDADDTDTEEPFESVEQNEDDGLSKEEKIIKRANNDILKHVKDPEEGKRQRRFSTNTSLFRQFMAEKKSLRCTIHHIELCPISFQSSLTIAQ